MCQNLRPTQAYGKCNNLAYQASFFLMVDKDGGNVKSQLKVKLKENWTNNVYFQTPSIANQSGHTLPLCIENVVKIYNGK